MNEWMSRVGVNARLSGACYYIIGADAKLADRVNSSRLAYPFFEACRSFCLSLWNDQLLSIQQSLLAQLGTHPRTKKCAGKSWCLPELGHAEEECGPCCWWESCSGCKWKWFMAPRSCKGRQDVDVNEQNLSAGREESGKRFKSSSKFGDLRKKPFQPQNK